MSLTGGLFASKPMFYGHKVPLLQSMLILNGDIILIIQFISLMSIVQDRYLHWVA
jgi:hypothetical protein